MSYFSDVKTCLAEFVLDKNSAKLDLCLNGKFLLNCRPKG